MISLLLVDSQRLFREGLVFQLSRCHDIESVFEATDLDEAFQLLNRRCFDIVLMEIELPWKKSFQAVSSIQAIDPNCKVVFLSGFDCDMYVQEAIAAGARGYVLKRDTLVVLTQAIATVAGGGLFFSEPIGQRLVMDNGRLRLVRPRSDAVASLTPRERELLAHLGSGTSLKEAATVMHVSYKTADNQKASLMRKLDIHDRGNLVRFAIREGWVAPA